MKIDKYTLEDFKSGNDEGKPDKKQLFEILELKRKTFQKAVDITLKAFKFSAEKLIKKYPDWLDLEIKKTESFINENTRLEQKYIRGLNSITANDLSIIDAELYQSTEKCYQILNKSEGRVLVSPWRNIDRSNPELAKMFIFKEYLPYLKFIRSQKEDISEETKREAIKQAADKTKTPGIAHSLLEKYVRIKGNSDLTKSQIFDQKFPEATITKKTFYNWANWYEEALKTILRTKNI